jgi:hypothetical protein
MRRFREQVDSCQGGELGEGIVILRVSRHILPFCGNTPPLMWLSGSTTSATISGMF